MLKAMMFDIAYPIYFLVLFYAVWNGIAELVFSHKAFSRRFSGFLMRLIFAPFWPLALFSPSGRTFLFNWSKGL